VNRSERRRQERAQARSARQKMPVMMVGDGIVAGELPGHQFEAQGGAALPPKVPGHHRWIATAAYVVRDVDAEKANDAEHFTFLDHENLMYLAIGCWDCEEPLGKIKATSTCPAPASDD
jgi:hypothetical protein